LQAGRADFDLFAVFRGEVFEGREVRELHGRVLRVRE
jgi:hypothetical protein